MKASIKNGMLCIEIPFDKKGTASKSGKSLIHAGTGGNQSVVVDGVDKPLVIGLNAYTKV